MTVHANHPYIYKHINLPRVKTQIQRQNQGDTKAAYQDSFIGSVHWEDACTAQYGGSESEAVQKKVDQKKIKNACPGQLKESTTMTLGKPAQNNSKEHVENMETGSR